MWYVGLEFSNMIVDEETSDVYVQTVNYLLKYSADLILKKTLITGMFIFIIVSYNKGCRYFALKFKCHETKKYISLPPIVCCILVLLGM